MNYESMDPLDRMQQPQDASTERAQLRTSQLLVTAGFRHAFFTRNGGASAGEFASLNFSSSVGDDPWRVEENITRAARALGVLPARVLFCSQVHGRTVHRLGASELLSAVLLREGDALVGRSETQAIGVRIADCVPILVGDRRSGAVAAIHAGWKGLVSRVIGAGISELREAAGHEGSLVAAIGPHIGTSRFEVSREVAAEISAVAEGDRVVIETFGEKPHVCLRAVVRAQLRALGLEDTAIDDVPGCTHSEPGDWFSFRRDGARSGRHLAAIVPRE